MKRIKVRAEIIMIYLIIIILSISIIIANNSQLYNKLNVIDDRKEVIKKVNMSIPVKIEFFNEKLGGCVLEDENSIKNIWSSINEITDDYSAKKEYKLKDNSQVTIKGNIEYLNGIKHDFEISNVFKLNNCTYCDNYKLPTINNLRNNLLNYLYSPLNLSKLINSQNEVMLVHDENKVRKIDDYEKEKIKNMIEKSSKIEDDREVIKASKYGQEPIGHIKVYMDRRNGEYLKVKSSNVMNIDIYHNDFFVVQYMGDENGRHIYMKGNLDELLGV